MGPIAHSGHVLKAYVRTFQFCYRPRHEEAGHRSCGRPGREAFRLPTTRCPTRTGKTGLSVCAPTEGSGQVSRENADSRLVRVVYRDHVLFHRSPNPDALEPQTRECFGWLRYESPDYIVVVFDRDAGPPTMKGGDPKASGLVILRSDLVKFEALQLQAAPSGVRVPHPS